MTYDEAYNKSANYFGSKQNKILTQYHHLIDKAKPILDVGAGQGRNSIYLARQGYDVSAFDPSQVGIDIIRQTASQEQLKINTSVSNMEQFAPENAEFSAILLFGIIQILSWDQINLLLNKIDRWTKAGSLVFIAAFRTDDPSFEKNSKNLTKVGQNSFTHPSGEFRTYLEPDQILSLFAEWKKIHHAEGLGPEHTHGKSQPHRHSAIEALLQKQA